MAKDDEEARRKRAERLRREIEELAGGARRPRPRSPHEWVEEKMREEAERRKESEEDKH